MESSNGTIAKEKVLNPEALNIYWLNESLCIANRSTTEPLEDVSTLEKCHHIIRLLITRSNNKIFHYKSIAERLKKDEEETIKGYQAKLKSESDNNIKLANIVNPLRKENAVLRNELASYKNDINQIKKDRKEFIKIQKLLKEKLDKFPDTDLAKELTKRGYKGDMIKVIKI